MITMVWSSEYSQKLDYSGQLTHTYSQISMYLAYAALNVTFLWETSNHHIQGGVLTSFQFLSYHLSSHSCTHIAYSLLQSKQLLYSSHTAIRQHQPHINQLWWMTVEVNMIKINSSTVTNSICTLLYCGKCSQFYELLINPKPTNQSENCRSLTPVNGRMESKCCTQMRIIWHLIGHVVHIKTQITVLVMQAHSSKEQGGFQH